MDENTQEEIETFIQEGQGDIDQDALTAMQMEELDLVGGQLRVQ